MIEKIQHRGLSSDEGQNKPNSFEGLSGSAPLEMDVFLLKDGTLAVIHNKDFNLSQEEVENLTLPELEKLQVPSRTGGAEGEVPLFKEALLNSLDRGNELFVEIKASSPAAAEKVADKLVAQIAELSREDKTFAAHPEYLSQVNLHSFSIEALEAAQEAMVREGVAVPRGLFWPSTPERANDMSISATSLERSGYQEGEDWTAAGLLMARQLGVEAIDLQSGTITPGVVSQAREYGLQIVAWVVNHNDEKIKELEALGVDKVLTED
jgi:glycerophosphoryl diester phosphodiesterase